MVMEFHSSEENHHIQRLVEGNETIVEKESIAELFNGYFVGLAKQLYTTAIPSPDSVPETDPSPTLQSDFNIPHMTAKQVAELLLSIPTHKATGHDGISARLSKIAVLTIANPLSRLINYCISTQTFPSKWKIAKVTPVFKGQGSKDDKENYRPISVLLILSKIFEKHICEHLRNYIHDHLNTLQSGFRRLHSTETALVRLVNQLLMDLDSNRVSGLAFVDYKKAFDLIDHSLLLRKLEAYRIRGRELELLHSYLSNRSQYVNIGGCCSSLNYVTCGVPQGSILGPVLFLLFINDLPSAVSHSVVDIYVDDTALSFSSTVDEAPSKIATALQQDLKELSRWSLQNKMTINAKKTKSMLITGKRLGAKLQNINLHVEASGTAIEQVICQKLLGVTVDNELNFDKPMDSLVSKLGQRLGLLRKIKRFLPLKQRINYYKVMFKQVMLYGATVWAECSKDNLLRILRMQKRAARVILDADTRANSVTLFKQLGWLAFHDEVKVNKCVLAYKRLNENCPAYISELLTTNHQKQSRSSGRYSNNNFVTPRYRLKTEGGRSFLVTTCKLWNSLPQSIKTANISTSTFRTQIIKHFYDSYKELNHFII